MKKAILLCICIIHSIIGICQQTVITITSYGAKPDGRSNNTSAIQKAIDDISKKGGKVIIPAGYFLTGGLYLRSNVELHLEEGAVLLGSTNRLDYTKGEGKLALLTGFNLTNVSITGQGTIDGQGRELVVNLYELLNKNLIQDPEWRIKRPTEANRPMILGLEKSKNIRVSGITFKDASGWVQNYQNCEDVTIDHIRVESVAYWNNDGIDIVDTKNVTIKDCFINSADDGICLKSEDKEGVCENITIKNCTIRSSANAFKIGTGSMGAFRNIVVENLTVYDTYRSAIALETVDGAIIEKVRIKHVRATHTGNAIFIRLGHRNTGNQYGILRDVLIQDVRAEIPASKPDAGYPVEGPLPKVPPHNLIPSSITGLPGHPVQNVQLENIEIVYGGGASKTKAFVSTDSLHLVPEQIPNYPEFSMFGELPAWGFYVRHAEGIEFSNVKLSLVKEDFRPACVFDDIKGLKLSGVESGNATTKPVWILNKVAKPVLTEVKSSFSEAESLKIQ
ncbi:glycoside hydrolase family 28 protein [Xanthocytophaga agilis]|uniref:Glycosyl hydrolase family 28 protein n=1 Tax=Xanthocytophaga agilis TaxID=3048010 RepID=A0AAE3R0K5_9BACT|nr:glycosyl hydrolase family 28 protein [Xanthocytophaga agilis]MDJ1501521.1 glycosyl hydrolase family 28 protein [Xanthocytophaga agilis]